MKNKLLFQVAKRNVLMLVLLIAVLTADAIPARPGFTKTLKLSDGTTVEARLVGDEHVHFWLGSDGKAYQAVAGSDVFQVVDVQALETRAKARRNARNKVIHASTSDGLGSFGLSGLGAVNSIGEYTFPVIMVEFSNKKFQSTTTVQKMSRFLNEEGYHDESGCVGSVRDYFISQSRGMFKPTFDVVGKVSLNKTYQTYGGRASDGSDDDPEGLVKDAVAAAVAQLGTDFSQYVRTTTNSAGTTTGVPLVCVFFAGYGQATGSENSYEYDTVWPCEVDCNTTMSGTKFNSFFVGNELYNDGKLMGMGIFCHETGHALGLPDFYVTNYAYDHDDPFGNWSIMDTGAYVKDARAPIGYNAYERSYLGWLDIPTYTPGEGKLLTPYTDESGTTAVKVATSSSTEYFILENRQPGTWYPEDMGSGLMVSRIAYSRTYWSSNTLNNSQNAKRAMIVTADDDKLYYSGQQSNLFGNGVNSITSLKRFSTGTVNPQINIITKNYNGTITLNSLVETPTFSIEAGTYADEQTVAISCATQGATIYYTTNGSNPTTSSDVYSTPIVVSESTTIKAIAEFDGAVSDVAEATYIITDYILYESLSKYTGSSDNGNSTIDISSSYLDFRDWKTLTKVYAGGTSNAYKEGGCLKIGSNSAVGVLETKSLSLTGKATLTFYLKKYNRDSNTLNVTVTGADADITQFTPTADWTLCTVNLTNATGNVTIKLATSTKRAYLDEIMLVPVKEISVSIGSTGYATLYYSNKNLVVPTGIEAYTYSIVNGKLDESWVYEAGEVIPRATGVVLTGEPGNYNFLVTTSAGDVDDDNLLLGYDEETMTAALDGSTIGYKFYMLSLNANSEPGSLGFYFGAAGGAPFMSKAHKAFLAVPTDATHNASYFLFNGETDGGMPTRIDNVLVSNDAKDGAIYDLQGRRVNVGQLGKGIYLMNGKKYLVK